MLSACPRFFDPCVSPRDKRGKVGSGNRGLEIAIRADNGRVMPQNCGINLLTWLFVKTTRAGVLSPINPETFMFPR